MTSRPSIGFGTRQIGSATPVCVIAEIGANHEGDVGRCRELIDAAADAGADAVKLQTPDPEREYAPDTASYETFRRAQLGRDDIADVFDFAKSRGVEIFSTTGDTEMLRFIDSLGPAAHKVSSGLADHVTMIRAAAQTGRPLLISTGMSSLSDVERTVSTARDAGAAEIALLQCTSLYPTEQVDANLAVIRTLQDAFDVPVGFSDHTLGTTVATLAVAAGATIIEKHMTFDTSREGFDHRTSLDPGGFRTLVDEVRRVEAILGDGNKVVLDEERDALLRLRRCVVAATDLEPGRTLSPEDLLVMRVTDKPADHIPAEDIEGLYGRAISRAVRRFQPVTRADV